ncbi:MAG: ubiquinol-cytochrome c reductase iron-sulfur subunit [Calothrix sp. MO_167.B42]|nr:ubiquinol-cytochrome c reductase iron-sulfur subunit [Calothrix sp. MO_167.B42]
MNRRNFINLFSVSLFISCLPIFTASYAAKPKPKKKPSESKNWINVGTVEELNKTGQILKEKSPLGPLLIVGKSNSANLIAVNPTCPHLGCTVDWEAEENIFLCPCHASEFTTDGKVQNGPATEPLPTYETKIAGKSVMVRRV